MAQPYLAVLSPPLVLSAHLSIHNTSEYNQALAKASGPSILLLIIRDNTSHYLVVSAQPIT